MMQKQQRLSLKKLAQRLKSNKFNFNCYEIAVPNGTAIFLVPHLYLLFILICGIIILSNHWGEGMRVEFRTVYDSVENEKYGELYAEHCIDKQLKQLKKMRLIIVIACVIGIFTSIIADVTVSDKFIPYTLFPLILIFTLIYIRAVKKKVYPKMFRELNGVGCPYNVTFGFYDEYFYEKFENNMCISEQSIRYEALQKVVETSEYFILMTHRNQVYFLPKRDMGYENTLAFSAFCYERLRHIYSFKK